MYMRVFLSFVTLIFSVQLSYSQGKLWDRAKEAVTDFETPSLSDLASSGTEKAVRLASDGMIAISNEFSRMKPRLEELGYHIENVQFQMLPPSAKWCVVSTIGEVEQEIDITDDDSAFVKSVMYAAHSAKKVQYIIDMPIVVLNIEIGNSTNIKLDYFSHDQIPIATRGSDTVSDSVCMYSQIISMR